MLGKSHFFLLQSSSRSIEFNSIRSLSYSLSDGLKDTTTRRASATRIEGEKVSSDANCGYWTR